VPRPRLHLDADASIRPLQRALLSRGHDVTRTPNEWMPENATDEAQLLGAAAHGRCILTFNVGDFMLLARRIHDHCGIILIGQRHMPLGDLIRALDRLLTQTDAADWPGQVRWLGNWRAGE
jgi:hypothetical protein